LIAGDVTMKRVLCVAAGVALVAAAGASAQNLDFAITTDLAGDAVVGEEFAYTISGVLTDGELGLALWGATVMFSTNGSPTTVGGQMSVPAGMESFDKNEGLTNPAGYGGTVSGNALLQVGGGQNTIGNTTATAPYPIGTVSEDIQSHDLATGTYTPTADQDGDTLRITVTDCFANRLDTGGGPTVYAVTATTPNCDRTAVVLVASGLPECFAPDVNCDGVVNGLDVGDVTAPANWFKLACADGVEPRADVNGDCVVNGLDVGDVTAPAAWFTSGHPVAADGDCACTTTCVVCP
jgi:hypothetical protein